MPLIVGPVSPANKSPPFGEAVGLGDGLGVPFGEPVGEGLGVPFGEPVGDGLGLAHGEALGDGLGLPVGEPDGEGVGLAEPKVPASKTVVPFNTWTGMPEVITGTCCPSSVRRVKKNVPHELTLAVPITALLMETVTTVPDGKLIDDPSTSRRLRF